MRGAELSKLSCRQRAHRTVCVSVTYVYKSQKQRRIAALNGRKTPQLKPQMESIVLAQAPRDGTYANNWLEHRVGLIDADDPLIEPGRFPGTVIPAKKPRNKHGHMTVKPVDLLRHLIRLFTAKGGKSIVLDPFAGSGSTGVAALQEARGFIGYELDPDMAKIANKRILRETEMTSPLMGKAESGLWQARPL